VVDGSFERFVLENGRPYVSQKLTARERDVVDSAIEEYHRFWGTFEHRQCFANSQRLLPCDRARRLVYVEGFAWDHAFHPVLHGWLSMNGKVIDVTLPARTLADVERPEPAQVRGEFDGHSYLGVPFLRSYVSQRLRATGGWGSLIDDCQHGYPLLRSRASGVIRRLRRIWADATR
jgi:hypothetical protein